MSNANNVTVRKFPVIAPDGTEYRIEVNAGDEPLFGNYVNVILFVPFRRNKFKSVYAKVFRGISGTYDRSNPDYIALATATVLEFYERERKKAEEHAVMQAALDRFAEWDGRITE